MEIETNNQKLLSDFEPVSFDIWKNEVEASLKGKPYEKLFNKTFEDIEIKPIYNKDDFSGIEDFINSIPGYEPFLRGNSPLGYKLNPWKIAQKVNHPIVKEANKIIIEELKRGVNAINLQLFFPDSQFELNEENIPLGIHIYSKENLAELFNEIPLNYPIFIEIKGNLKVGNDLILDYFKNKKVELFISFDPISNYLTKGLISKNVDQMINNAISNSNDETKSICVNSGIYQNAGASADQEIAFALSIVNYFLMNVNESNLDKLVNSLWVNTSVGPHFFMEIAKLRAFKVLLSKLLENYGISNKIHFHTQTTSINKSKLDIYTNMLRLTGEAFSAVLGGSDSIEVGNFDEINGLSNEFSRRFSRNIQIILQEECNLNQITDPAGGSFYIEKLTFDLAKKSWELFQHIENLGGIYQIITDGHLQKWVTFKANDRIENLSLRKDILVGVNKYANTIENEIEYEKIDFNLLKSTFEINKENSNSLLNSIFDQNEFVEVTGVDRLILTENFEKLKEMAYSFAEKYKSSAKVYLCNIGSLKEYKPRADFATDFFRVGYFDVINPKGFLTVEEAMINFYQSDARVLCICSSDEKYPEIVENIIRLVRRGKPFTQVILAGYPVDKVEDYKKSGIDNFIHIKANIYEVLSKIYESIDY